MKAARIHRFGPPDVIEVEDIPRPSPAPGEVLVRVAAAGVGPWDALIREGKSKVSPPPLTLGSDLSGVLEAVGTGVSQFKTGDEVDGVTNAQFVGANADFAVASADMVAPKPQRLSSLEAASVPVVAVTAWQMLFEHARPEAGQRVMILGAAGNVGAYAVQFAANAGFHVIAVVGSQDVEFVRNLGATDVIDYRVADFAKDAHSVDVVIDTVGGNTRDRAFGVLRPGGILVTVVSTAFVPGRADVRSAFFYAEVTTARLSAISGLLDRAIDAASVGRVLSTSLPHETAERPIQVGADFALDAESPVGRCRRVRMREQEHGGIAQVYAGVPDHPDSMLRVCVDRVAGDVGVRGLLDHQPVAPISADCVAARCGGAQHLNALKRIVSNDIRRRHLVISREYANVRGCAAEYENSVLLIVFHGVDAMRFPELSAMVCGISL